MLCVERVCIYDNFFELSGHCLLAMRMVYYIERKLLLSIPIHVLFQFTSISDLSKYLEIQTNSSPETGLEEKDTTAYKLIDV